MNLQARHDDSKNRFAAMERRREEAERIRLECEAEMLRLQGEIRLLEALMREAGAQGTERTQAPGAPAPREPGPQPGILETVAGNGHENETGRPLPGSKP